jgi:lipid II:glycine glycyltransferase (peptidoglycan interpeptide bridge formation enzyme)
MLSDAVMTLQQLQPDAVGWQHWTADHAVPLLQQMPWAELKQRFGWQVARLIVSDGPRQAAAQLLIRSRFGIGGGYLPHGPHWSGDTSIDSAFLQALSRLARRRRLLFVRIENDIAAETAAAAALHQLMLSVGARAVEPLQPRTTVILDLTPPPAELLRACSKGHRADIARAERLGVNVRQGSAADIPAFAALMQTTGRRKDFAVHSADYYAAALALHGERARLLIAELDGRMVAGHLYISDGTTVAYLYSGADPDGLKAGANHLLSWTAISWARTSGASRFDFWGIPDAYGAAEQAADEQQRQALLEQAKDDPLNGVYRFKKGFGGRIVRRVPAYDLVFVPAPLYRLALRRIGG